MIEKNSRQNVVIWSLIYALVITFVYSFLQKEFNFKSINREAFYFLFVIIFILIPLRFIPTTITRSSHLFQWIFYLLVYVPTNVSAYFSMQLDELSFLLFILFFCISFMVLFSFNGRPVGGQEKEKMKPNVFWVLFGLLYVYFNFLIVENFGLNLKLSFDFREVYNIRADFKEQVGSGGLSMYIEWLEYIFNPLLIAIGIINRKYYFLILGILGELLIYSVAAYKTALLLPFPIIFLTFFFKKYFYNRESYNIPVTLLKLSSILIVACFLIDYIFLKDSILYKYFFSDTLIRRTLLVPGYLTVNYVEYFTNHPKVYLDNSEFFNSLFINAPSQYSRGIPYAIGYYISGDTSMSANTNFLADAFANFGYIGMIIYSYLAAFFLFLFDKHSLSNKVIGFILVFSISYFLSNSSLIVSIIGHGGIFALILMIFLPKGLQKKN